MLETVKPEVISDPQDAAITKLSAVQALDKLVHRIAWPAAGTLSYDEIVSREWLVTNGLGGYASGTVAGAITRRYHAPLIAALPAPHGRVVMLNHLSERIRLPDRDGRLARRALGRRQARADRRDAASRRVPAGSGTCRCGAIRSEVSRSRSAC